MIFIVEYFRYKVNTNTEIFQVFNQKTYYKKAAWSAFHTTFKPKKYRICNGYGKYAPIPQVHSTS